MIGSEDYTLVTFFVSKGFPRKDHFEELFIVMFICYVFPTRTLSTFSLSSLFLTETYFPKARCSIFMLKVPLQAINQAHIAASRTVANDVANYIIQRLFNTN